MVKEMLVVNGSGIRRQAAAVLVVLAVLTRPVPRLPCCRGTPATLRTPLRRAAVMMVSAWRGMVVLGVCEVGVGGVLGG